MCATDSTLNENPHHVLEFAMATYILSPFGQENKLIKALSMA
jgi:hypothetical protein